MFVYAHARFRRHVEAICFVCALHDTEKKYYACLIFYAKNKKETKINVILVLMSVGASSVQHC